jgi:hypothetical protein
MCYPLPCPSACKC